MKHPHIDGSQLYGNIKDSELFMPDGWMECKGCGIEMREEDDGSELCPDCATEKNADINDILEDR